MSHCKQEGKDRIIFLTREDQDEPIQSVGIKDLEKEEEEEEEGLILPNGDINWNCPCLGGMASGPCGVEFREAFSCFHYSEAESKGSDCIDNFRTMQECMVQYPDLYPVGGDKEQGTREEAEVADQNQPGPEAHPINSDTKDAGASPGSDTGPIVEEAVTTEEAVNHEDADVRETTGASSEKDGDAVAMQEEGKS